MNRISLRTVFPRLLLLLWLFLPAGGLYAANNEEKINFGASAAVQESKIRDQAEEELAQPKAEKPLAFGEEKVKEVPATGPSFFVKTIFLEGDVILAPSEYEPLLQKYEGREIRFAELQQLINTLEQLFRAKGYIAVVLLPPQKMENQEIHLKAVTSRMGELLVDL